MDASDESRSRVMQLAGRDPFLLALGVTCLDGGPGRAAVAITLREEHMNFMGVCHGGLIFTLADTAFGLAANSHGPMAAGIDAHITYQISSKVGDTVTATAVEVSRTRKIAVYRVDVTRGDGALLSVFTGTVYVTSRHNG